MADPFEIEEPPTEVPTPPYLRNLNEAQRAAVETVDGPVLVLAGAGTGKTRVLITRLAHLVQLGKAQPWQILAVTFTNKAATEMRERVADLLGGPAESLWLGTFHSLGGRILRRHAELVGLKSNFTILDTDDQIRLLKQLLGAHNVDEKKWPARVLIGVIQRWKDRGLTCEKISAADAGDLAGGRIRQVYEEYQARLKTLNAADFGDLLLHCLTLFTAYPEVLQTYQAQFSYILVDEYQDTNVAQYLWLRLLAQRHRNIACVGDDDQSIYGWRGAEVGNILRFEKDFPGAKIVRLEQNYRSTEHILGAAAGLIAKNEGRLGKTLWTQIGGGDRVTVRGVWDGEEEARAVVDMVEDVQRAGEVPLRELAVLVRASSQTRAFEERLLTCGVPYRVIGGPRFYERLEVRDALAYLRVINQPDDDLAFERIVNRPKRGLGIASVQTVHIAARTLDVPLFRAAHQVVETDELKPRARTALSNLLAGFERWRAMAEALPQAEVAEQMLEESGYTDMLLDDKSPEAAGRLENLKELVVAMEEFENLGGFLEHVALVMENTTGAGQDVVNLMTLHSAKGLEFDTVFLPGWEEGIFPNQRSLDESGAAGLEEERRLAYVGLTRAKRKAVVLFAANRHMHGQWLSAVPSRFVGELPEQHVDLLSESGLYGNTAKEEPAVELAPPPTRLFGGRQRWRSHYGARNSVRRPPGAMIEGEAYAIREAKPSGFAKGTRVFHQKFGYGEILKVEDNKLEIAFDKAGVKKVMDSFVVQADAV